MDLDLSRLTPPQGLSEHERETIFTHLFRRLASFRNTLFLYSSQDQTLSPEARHAHETSIQQWAQGLIEVAFVICGEPGGGHCPELDPLTDTATAHLRLPPPEIMNRFLNALAFLNIANTKEFSALTRSFLSTFGSLDERLIVAALKNPQRAIEETKKIVEATREKHSQQGKLLRMAGVGLAAVAGGVLVGVTGGLAAPLVGASVGTVLGILGVGGTAAGLLATALASSTVICGALFGVYGGHTTSSMVRRHTREVKDLDIVPVHPPKEHEALAVRLCVSGWLTSKEDVIAPWTIFDADGDDTFALQWEVELLESLSNALTTLVKTNAIRYLRVEVLKRTVFATLMASLAPVALLKFGEIMDNDWMNSQALAIKVGAVLGSLLEKRVFGHRPISLTGYSLGALVIMEALKYLASLPPSETLHLVQDVYLFGTPAPSDDIAAWTSMRRLVSGRLVNGYSQDDYVLAVLCRLSSVSWGVAGMQSVDVLGVENVLCEVDGHTRWRTMIGKSLLSFLGGLGLSLPLHALLTLNGNVFGISGFLHRSFRGNLEAIASTAGLLLGGVVVGLVEGPSLDRIDMGSLSLVISGLLVGVGTKMANGCTSGHMLAGLSRFSPRSAVATTIFFCTGAITSHIVHAKHQRGSRSSLDWTLDATGSTLLALQTIPLLTSAALYFSISRQDNSIHAKFRLLASLATGFEFALALRLSSLTEAQKVIDFLLLPGHEAFDPSLAFLAFGALPSCIILYRYARGSEIPRLGGAWSIPKNSQVDTKLVVGSAIFGVGWGLSGFCPGPGIVNLGRAVGSGMDVLPFAVWLGAVVMGGVVV
ncbi:hypothetical protein MIND_01021400 [Mycena indigotica]|uniref:DUF726-domain-containing protein n=1 Tax=Mycena indigotica TaxID=2126181 RepID=A0A8H6SBJ4_9AGAR|nr:uncharacterized protein MIND_01021400 [Mycena indigotica]KAF7294835.1 hypothetical protein MIND_01021400 [Mycena indigotica]